MSCISVVEKGNPHLSFASASEHDVSLKFVVRRQQRLHIGMVTSGKTDAMSTFAAETDPKSILDGRNPPKVRLLPLGQCQDQNSAETITASLEAVRRT
jgi:hypothetical protein